MESRILQRISKYKMSNSSIIPSMHKKDQMINTSMLMYSKKKELDSIIHYKESHKEQYMEHVVNEAMEKYNTETAQLGEVRYFHVKFTNSDNKTKKISFKLIEVLKDVKKEVDKGSSWTFIDPLEAK